MTAGLIETGIVLAIVGVAAWHAIRTLVPREWLRRATSRADFKESSGDASCSTGCGTCGGCGTTGSKNVRMPDQ